jgi:hypothetical protein
VDLTAARAEVGRLQQQLDEYALGAKAAANEAAQRLDVVTKAKDNVEVRKF